MTIKQINDKNLIIIKEDETYFFNVDAEDGLKIRQQFLTMDGYEEGINIKLSFDELQALSKTINNIIENVEYEDFVAVGDTLVSDIEFRARNIDEAWEWAKETIGWDVDVLTMAQYESL